MSFRVFEARGRATQGHREACWGYPYGVSGLVRRRHIMARLPSLRRPGRARTGAAKRPRSPVVGAHGHKVEMDLPTCGA